MTAWKALENKVAQLLDGERQPNKGAHNAEDVEHPLFVIECKSRQKIAFIEWWRQAAKHCKGKAKSKIPLLVVKQKGARGEFAILLVSDLIKLFDSEGVDYRQKPPGNDAELLRQIADKIEASGG